MPGRHCIAAKQCGRARLRRHGGTVTSLATRIVRGVTSSGFGYEPHEQGARFSVDSVEGYFIDYRPKIESQRGHPEEPLYAADTAHLALGWWERVLEGRAEAEAAFLGLCQTLRDQAEVAGDALLWPYRVQVPKYGRREPWYSALAQGQAASVFVRAWRQTGDETYADSALRSIAPLLRPGPTDILVETPAGPILEEYGSAETPGHILNGWIFALWGVRDVSLALGDAGAAALTEASTACLASTLPRYDTGWWSRYSLYPHAVPDLAKPFYHRLHVTQLEILHALTAVPVFRDTAVRWRSFDTRPRVALTLASKVPFSAANAVAARSRR